MPSVVIDASAFLAVTLNEPNSRLVSAQLALWGNEGMALKAPTLLPYEWASGMSKAIARGSFDPSQIERAWNGFHSIPIELHDLDGAYIEVVKITVRLGRRSAYDAAYLALAGELGAELWTLDGPLYRNALASGFEVRLFG